MYDTYKILHLQNTNSTAEIAENELRKGNIRFDHYVVTNEDEYLQALDKYKPDIILCDYSSATLHSMGALKLIKSHNLNIPFIVISTNPTEEINNDFIKEAADDFLVNDMLKHLPVAIEKAIRRHSLDKERKQLKQQISEKDKTSARHFAELTGKFLQATKTAGIGIWEYSFETNNIEADDILLSHYGLTASQINGNYRNLLQLLSAEDKVRIISEFKAAVASRADIITEYKVTWNDGSVHYISTSAHLQCDDKDDPCRFIGTSQDITSAMLAKQQLSDTSLALQKTLSELKKIMNSSLDVICTMDEHGKFINVSAASEKLWGYKPAELIGKLYTAFVYKEDQAKTIRAIADITSGTNMTNFENYQVCKDGSMVPMVLSARWDENDKTLYCIAREATEKRQADAQLLVSEQRFKDLIQGGSDLIVILSQEGNYKYVSPNAIDVLGFDAEHFIGKNTFSFMHPDDVEMAVASFSKIADEKKIVVPPLRFLHKNGSWRWLDSSVTNFIDNPGINGIVINARDITDRKVAEDKVRESEARLEVAQAVAQVGSWQTDLSTLKVEWSKENYRIFEVSDEEELLFHQTFLKMTHPEDRKKVDDAFTVSLTANTINSIEHRVVTPTGKIKTVEEKWRVVTDEQGKPVSVVGTTQDISERKKIEQVIAESEAFSSGVLNSLSSHIAVVNASGTIIKVNETWDAFAINNGGTPFGRFGEGANYFEACENADDIMASETLQGIKKVLAGNAT